MADGELDYRSPDPIVRTSPEEGRVAPVVHRPESVSAAVPIIGLWWGNRRRAESLLSCPEHCDAQIESDMAASSDLPFGSEFSPSQINLPELLEIAHANQGNPHALEAAILAKWFVKHAQRPDDEEDKDYNQRKLANNCKLGMIAYGVIDREARFTPFGERLFDLRGDEVALYEELARHILLNLRGMTFVQCLQDMVAAGEEITLDTLRGALAERGVNFPRGGKHPSMMRLWLAKAGVIVGARWQVNPIRVRAILGVDPGDYPALAWQPDCAPVRLAGPKWISSSILRGWFIHVGRCNARIPPVLPLTMWQRKSA